MFKTTLEAAELFSNVLKCSQCDKINNNLQALGSNCKHGFCWDCVNGFMKSDTFVLCPLCKLPLELNRPTNCYLFNNLSSLLSELRSALTKCSNTTGMDSAETQHILTALQNPVERRIEDFCSQQICDEPPSISDDQDNFEHDFHDGSPIERSMEKDDNFFIETSGLNNIGKPVDHSTQKEVADIFASQAVPEWNPITKIQPIIPPLSKGKSVPQEWIDEYRERSAGLAPKRNSSEAVPRRSSSRLSNEKEKKREGEKEKKKAQKMNSSIMFDEEDESFLDMAMMDDAKRHRRDGSTVKTVPEKKKSDIHMKKKSLGGKKGESVLINSIIIPNEKQLRDALESGCDPNERDPDGKTAIYLAAERNLAEICLILIEKGAVVNAYCGEECWTPLHAATSFDAMDAARILISKGASRKARDLKGRTPEMVAMSEEMKLMITRHSSVPLQIVFPPRKNLVLFLSDGIDPKVRRIANSMHDVKSVLSEANILVVEGQKGKTTLNANILEAIARGYTIVTEDWISEGGDERQFEVKSIKSGDECEYEGGCIASRKNAQKMMPPLLYGTSFYFCHTKYGSISKNEYVDIIKAGGGTILTREPMPTGNELNPFHARQLSPYFVFFNPCIQVSQKLIANDRLNLASFNWLQESIGRFELIKPY